jgi:hypothetical protein
MIRGGPQMGPHQYVWTIAGKCSRCGMAETAHPKLDRSPDRQCSIDHASILVTRLIGDEGESWTPCPVCHQQIEPKLPEDSSATGKRMRSPYGRGRLPFTQRHMNELVKLREAYDAGYFKP